MRTVRWRAIASHDAAVGADGIDRVSRTRDMREQGVGIASTAVTKNTACADTKWPQAPMTPAASPLPMAAKRALRLEPLAERPHGPRGPG